MVSNKLMAAAFAALASLAVVDAGVCKPSGSTSVSTASATATSVAIETGSTTVASAETSSGTTSSASAQTTSTTAEASSETSASLSETASTTGETTTSTLATPTDLITNPEFETNLSPWQAIPYPDQTLTLTTDSHELSQAARLLFESKSGSPFTNYLYHRIEKNLLTPGSYSLQAYWKVDEKRVGEGDGCTRAVASCLVGPVGDTAAIPGSVAVLPARDAEGRWARITARCDIAEETLLQFDDFGVAVGFECINSGVNFDTASFKRIEETG